MTRSKIDDPKTALPFYALALLKVTSRRLGIAPLSTKKNFVPDTLPLALANIHRETTSGGFLVTRRHIGPGAFHHPNHSIERNKMGAVSPQS